MASFFVMVGGVAGLPLRAAEGDLRTHGRVTTAGSILFGSMQKKSDSFQQESRRTFLPDDLNIKIKFKGPL